MPPEDGTIGVVRNGEYIRIDNTAIGDVWTTFTPLVRNDNGMKDRLDELEARIREIQSRLDSMCIDAEELHILKEQVSLLELLKPDAENS